MTRGVIAKILKAAGSHALQTKKETAPSFRSVSRVTCILLLAGATGFEPAISGLTGQHVNRYTTPP